MPAHSWNPRLGNRSFPLALVAAPALLLLMALVPVVTTAAQPDPAPTLVFEKYVLPNGLQVILHEDHTIPLVAVNIWYHVGSRDEKPGRTGFAHLFEHMMFQGSAHHDQDYFLPLQSVGGQVNGSTNTDRTNYWENVPSDYLQRALFLEADRMGQLLPALTQAKLDNQRDVVKNEKRQGENRPYGRSREWLNELLFDAGHPYRTPVVGSMADLGAASIEDVSEFFALNYAPNNASLCVAGDFDPARARAWIETYFGPIAPGRPTGRVTALMPALASERRAVYEDVVELPRLHMAWHTPGYYAPGDAEFDLLGSILAGGKTSRLYRRLVHELRLAQEVRAWQSSRELSGVFEIQVTAAPGHGLAEIEAVLDAELAALLDKGVQRDELALAQAAYEADFVRDLQRVGGFGGKADRLNRYNLFAGDPDYLARDLARFREARTADVNRWLRQYLGLQNRAVLHIVPQGRLAAEAGRGDPSIDLTSLPASTGAPVFVPPSIQAAQLPNGLRIYLVEKHTLPLVEARLNLMSGWSSDPADRLGVAALTADLLDEGAGGRDAVALARAAAALGADLGTASAFDGSAVTLSVLKSRAAAGLELVRDVALRPSLAAADFERVRASLGGRQKQEADQPRQLAITAWQRRCFGAGHPYAQPITGSGTPEALAALTLADVREFHRQHYRPDNAALVVVGDLTLAETVALATAAFGDWSAPAEPLPPAQMPAPAPQPGARVVVIDRPGAAQSFVVGGHLAPTRNDPDHLALEIANTAFGGQFSSRINLNLREDKGYTYGVRSELVGLRASGLFLMAAPVETAATAAAVKELVAELEGLCGDRPVTGRELADSRNRLAMGFPQDFQTYAGVAAELGQLLQYDLPLDQWQRFAGQVGALGADDVAAAVARHLDPAQVVWVIVGDWQVIGPSLAELGLGEPEVVPGTRNP